MINEWDTGKCLEGGGRSLLSALHCTGNCREGLRTCTTKNFSPHADDLDGIRTKHLLNMRQGMHCYTNS